MNWIYIISLLLSITFVVGIVVYINTNTNTSVPTKALSNTSVPTGTQVPTSVPTQVQPDNYTELYEYLSTSEISKKKVSGYRAGYTPISNTPDVYTTPYAYSLLNTSPYNITKVGLNFTAVPTNIGTWLYKLDKNKVASQGDSWTTIYGNSGSHVQNILIEPGESFVIDMTQLFMSDTLGLSRSANFEITFVEVLLPG